MELEKVIGILGIIGAYAAVIVAMKAIKDANKNSRQQILIEKLEELFEIIQSLSRYYAIFKELYFLVLDQRDANKKGIQTLGQYYKVRDVKLPQEERKEIIKYLSRIQVLANCYTKNDLQEQVLKYENLMYSFADFVFNAGSIQQELFWKEGFPKFEDFNIILENLKKNVISQIKIY